jgi:hypothetical protein
MTISTATEQQEDLYWAVVEHVRTWLSDDGPFIQSIKRMNGVLDGVTLRRIAINYNVSRGIRGKGEDGDAHAVALAQLINGTRSWPSGLVQRAQVCAELAREAKEKCHTHGVQASAITKFSWFAQPLGWTVYDRFVRSAMDIRDPDPLRSMVSFYRELEQRGFLGLAAQIQTVLDNRQIMPLHGTRVLDKLMMLNGADKLKMRKAGSASPESDWAGNIRSLCREFLQLLPPDWRRAVEDVAEHVTDQVSLGAFLQTK